MDSSQSVGSGHPDLSRTRLRAPRVGPRDLVRARLLASIEAKRLRPLTVIVAPSGYGKTTMLAQWAARHTAPVVWVALDAVDDQPVLLAMALIAAIGQWRAELGRGGLALLAANQKADPAGVGAAIAEDLAAWRGGAPIAIVLDDVHELTSPESWTLLGGLIAAAAPTTHIVLASRLAPQLDFSSARQHGRLVELGSGDLTFTDDEAYELAGRIGIADLERDMISDVHRQSGGWAALLRMLLVRLDGVPRRISADDATSLVDRLVDFVLPPLTPAVREAALWSSILHDLQDELLASILPPELAGVAGADIDALAAIGLPMTRLVGDGGWARLHPMVIEALGRRLRAGQTPEAIAAGYRRAAVWHHQRGLPEEAVRYAVAAGDIDGAVELVAAAGMEALAEERWVEISSLLDLLPAWVAESHPVIAAIEVWHTYRVAFEAMGPAIGKFHRACEAGHGGDDPRWPLKRLQAFVEVPTTFGFYDPPGAQHARERAVAIVADLAPEDQSARGVLIAATGFISGSFEGTREGIRYIEEALAKVPAANHTERATMLAGMALIEDLDGASYDRIDHLLDEALALATAGKLGLTAAFAAAWLTWSALHRVELDVADTRLVTALAHDLYAASNLWRQIIYGQAMLAALRGRGDEAMETANRAVAMLTRHNVYDWATNAAAFRARIALLVGRPEVAEEWLESIPVQEGDIMPGLHEALDLTRARVLLVQPSPERVARATDALDRLSAQALNLGLPKLRDPILVCRARALEASGQVEEAIATLIPALTSLAARGDLLTLVEHGDSLDRLLGLCRERDIEPAFIDRVAGAAQQVVVVAVVSPAISRVERRILEMMALGQGFDVMAVSLGVSVNVTRQEVRRLFARLRVSGRSDALAAARAQGLLPPA